MTRSCIVSNGRECKFKDYFYTQSEQDVVFIAASNSQEVREDILKIQSVLKEYGLIGIFATLSRENTGFDAFCDKICSYILRSKFCVVLLNAPLHNKLPQEIEKRFKISLKGSDLLEHMKFPSANVYFEYGVMASLKKDIIPLYRGNLEDLPFNIKGIDTIGYKSIEDLETIVGDVIEKKFRIKKYKTPIPDIIDSEKIEEIIETKKRENELKNWFSNLLTQTGAIYDNDSYEANKHKFEYIRKILTSIEITTQKKEFLDLIIGSIIYNAKYPAVLEEYLKLILNSDLKGLLLNEKVLEIILDFLVMKYVKEGKFRIIGTYLQFLYEYKEKLTSEEKRVLLNEFKNKFSSQQLYCWKSLSYAVEFVRENRVLIDSNTELNEFLRSNPLFSRAF